MCFWGNKFCHNDVGSGISLSIFIDDLAYLKAPVASSAIDFILSTSFSHIVITYPQSMHLPESPVRIPGVHLVSAVSLVSFLR